MTAARVEATCRAGHQAGREAMAAEIASSGSVLTLSDQRAKAVVAWLTPQGIAAGRLVPKGYGDASPVGENTTDEGRAKNRRVELKKLN